jgi:hypothetical protein
MFHNKVPIRVKNVDNLEHYITKNFVVYTGNLVQCRYFKCPQPPVTCHSLPTLYITPTHSLVPTLLIGKIASSLQPTCHHCADFCMIHTGMLNTSATRSVIINWNESTSLCQFHTGKQFTNAWNSFGQQVPFQTEHKHSEDVCHLFLASALERGEWSASPPCCFIPKENHPGYTLIRKLRGSQSWSAWFVKSKNSLSTTDNQINDYFEASLPRLVTQ